MTTTTTTTYLPIRGRRYILGGSVATCVATGTVHVHGVPAPTALMACSDYGPGFIRLTGVDLLKLGPEAK